MRHLSMADFRSDEAKALILQAKIKGNPKLRVHVGQLLGQVNDVVVKTSIDRKTNEERSSLAMYGEFEGVKIHPETGVVGEAITSGTCYMPKYYAEEIAAQVKRAAGAIFILTDVYMVGASESPVGYAYDVVNQRQRPVGHPLDAIKAEAMKMGILRLPAPKAAALAAPEETTTIDGEVTQDDEVLATEAGDAIVENKTKGGRKAA